MIHHSPDEHTETPIFSRFIRAPRLLLFAVVATVVTGWGLSGCISPGQAVQRGLNTAGETAGEAFGRAIGNQLASAANLPPAGTARYNQFMVSQAQILFTYAFSAGGTWPAQATYEPGEWTKYRLRSSEDETNLQTMERAFLKTTDDGKEWWRVQAFQGEDTWVYEALLDPTDGKVVRLRAQDPEGAVSEVPVTEETVYQPPQRLTEESVEGATVGTETIDTPAGTFSARRVEYNQSGGGGATTWFLSEDVPGHVVQYQFGQGEGTYTSTLVEYGADATTQLDSY